MSPPSLGTFLLLHVFPAFLPPIPDDEVDYYEALDLTPRSSTPEEIRKAYKKISLRLHPDKIAQRGETVTPEIQQRYQLVQEAYAVLSDDTKRSLYHACGGPTRYRFVSNESGEALNPAVLYANLAAASWMLKSRIVIAIVLVQALVLLTPIMIAVKINHVLDTGGGGGGTLENTSWTVILIPLWVLQGLYVLAWFLLSCITQDGNIALFGVEQLCWWIGEFVISLRWDGVVTADYVLVAIPIYVAMVTRWVSLLRAMRNIRYDVHRMITLKALEAKLGRPYDDLTEEERRDITEEYLIVHVPPDTAAAAVMMEDGMDPEHQVELSPEFEAANEAYYRAWVQLVRSILFAVPMVVLLLLKVDGHLPAGTSWWIVFLPVWIFLGLSLLYDVYMCCCGTVVGTEVVLDTMVGEDDDDLEMTEEEEDQEQSSNVRPSEPAKPESSTRFADAEGDMDEFNNIPPVKTPSTSTTTTAIRTTTTPAATSTSASQQQPTSRAAGGDDDDDDEIRALNKARVEAAVKKALGDPVARRAAAAASSSATEAADDAHPDVMNVEGGDDDDDEEFFMDEETFQQWQSAYQEAQTSAMEAQTKAQADCCLLLFQLMMMCLIVGKLDKALDDDADDNNPNDVGYNALWILFPIFVVFGCVLCCCALLIYGAGKQGLDDFVDSATRTNDDEEEAGGGGGAAAAANDEEEGNTSAAAAAAAGGAENKNSNPILYVPPTPVPTPGTTTTTETTTTTITSTVATEGEQPSRSATSQGAVEEAGYQTDELD